MNAASIHLHIGRTTPATRGGIDAGCDLADVRLVVASHPPATTLGWHSHPVANIAVVLRGSLCERIRGAAHAMRCGDAVFKPAGERHSNIYGTDGARTLLLEIYGRDKRTRIITGPRVLRSRETRHIASALHRALTAQPRQPAHVLEALSWSLVASFEVNAETAPVPPAWLGRVRERLADEWRRPPSVVEAAAIEGVHAAHLIRAFGRAFGTSPGAYVRERRVLTAHDAIVRTRLPLAQIAGDCGFADQSHMCREVRRRFGRPPLALRRDSIGHPRDREDGT